MPSKDVLADALEAAVEAHLARLFEILLRDTDEQSLKRFQNGLKKLAQAEHDVGNLIENMNDADG